MFLLFINGANIFSYSNKLKEICIVKYIQISLKIYLFVIIKKSKNGWVVKMMDRHEENVI